MPQINQQTQPGAGGGLRAETPEEKEGWFKLRQWIRQEGIAPGESFQLPGTITKIKFDGTEENPRYFVTKRPMKQDDGSVVEKEWAHVKVYAAITDRQFGKPGLLTFPPMNTGATFFDGRQEGRPRSPLRGGLFNIHFAVKGEEPPPGLVDRSQGWDSEWYENKPVMLVLRFNGYEEEGSKYAGRRADLNVQLTGFARDRKANPNPGAVSLQGPEERVVTQMQAEQRTQDADLGKERATERQLKFIQTLAREAGLDAEELENWSLELFARETDQLNRLQASRLIDALQRRRNDREADPKPAASSAPPAASAGPAPSAATKGADVSIEDIDDNY